MRIFLLPSTPKMWYNNKNIATFQFIALSFRCAVGAVINRPPNHLHTNDWDFAEINWIIALRQCDFVMTKSPGG